MRHLAGSASTEKAIGERAQGSQWLLNSVFLSGRTQLNAKHDPLTSSWNAERKGASLFWGFYFNGLPHPHPKTGSWMSCYILKMGKVERWHWTGPPMSGKPCSNYMFLQPRNLKARVAAGRKLYNGKGVRKEGKKSVWGMTESAWQFTTSASALYKPTTKDSIGLERSQDSQDLKISTTKHHLWLHCYRERLLCHELSSCPFSYPVSQILDE